MHDSHELIESRITRAYTDAILPHLYTRALPLAVTAWHAPGEPVPFETAVTQQFAPFPEGSEWGRPWGTTWIRVAGQVPQDWPVGGRTELLIDLGFTRTNPGFQCEGLAWSADGTIIKGIEPRNSWVRIRTAPGKEFELFIEAAANPDFTTGGWFQPSVLGDRATAGDSPLYRFNGISLANLDETVFHLERDVWTLSGLLPTLPPHSPRRARIMRALELSVDALDPDDVAGSADAARAELAGVLADRAVGSAHRVIAVGHAHIDSAWLWPVRETVRKCARTFSNVLELIEEYEDFVFVASSAQQYAWVKERYPELFERIRSAVASGRFVPVGGMWVESDTTMPGGEALARQLVTGKSFFMQEFGIEPREVWLPDSFGYSAGLPQIVVAAGSENFLTQKMSWNDTNKFPHHSFLWEGLDGTQVLTHMPPVASYNSDLSAEDLARAEREHAERGVSDLSLVPYGFGDGGGGPTREMIETARRKKDLDGSPRVTLADPATFFSELRAELTAPAVWSGELYLEYHRGTYTSQSRTKQGNRRSEHLLREAELWATTATVRTGAAYPFEALRSAWQTTLLQQFHDILPGSSIAWVHQEAERNHAAVASALEDLIAHALAGLGAGAATGEPVAFNASPFAVDGVPPLGAGVATANAAVEVSATSNGGAVLTSPFLTAAFDGAGLLISLIDVASGAELVPVGEPGNDLQLFRDIPNQWDAWDIDAAYQRVRLPVARTVSVGVDPDTVKVVREIGHSTVSQVIGLSADGRALEIETTVDWTEQHKLLKLAFPFDVHADGARSEVQFGHVRRPIHVNTSWDAARFETVAHRWVRIEDASIGVTISNDRVYGHDVTRHTRHGGGSTTVLRESLLRAPRFPDPGADQGNHVFRHSISVGDLLVGIADGYRLNLPLRRAVGTAAAPLVAVEGEGVLIEALKLADDGSGDVIVRLYEAQGGHARARIVADFAVTSASRTDLLERPLGDQPAEPLTLNLRAFELVTVRLARA
jgi:alpha-mannosidase